MVEDYDQHQQIAVSLADDLVGEARPSAPQHKSRARRSLRLRGTAPPMICLIVSVTN